MLKIYIILKNNNIRVCEKALWKQDVNLMRHKGCHSWALIGWRVAVWNLWLAHRVASLWQTPPLSVMTSLRRSSRWTFPCGGEREREQRYHGYSRHPKRGRDGGEKPMKNDCRVPWVFAGFGLLMSHRKHSGWAVLRCKPVCTAVDLWSDVCLSDV